MTVTTCHGMNFPLCWSAFFAASFGYAYLHWDRPGSAGMTVFAAALIGGRVGFLVALAVLVVIFVALRVRLSSYVTILVNLYFGIFNFGGLLQVHDRSAMSGLLIQLVAICGIVVAVAGIIQGIRQRLNYTYSRLEGK